MAVPGEMARRGDACAGEMAVRRGKACAGEMAARRGEACAGGDVYAERGWPRRGRWPRRRGDACAGGDGCAERGGLCRVRWPRGEGRTAPGRGLRGEGMAAPGRWPRRRGGPAPGRCLRRAVRPHREEGAAPVPPAVLRRALQAISESMVPQGLIPPRPPPVLRALRVQADDGAGASARLEAEAGEERFARSFCF